MRRKVKEKGRGEGEVKGARSRFVSFPAAVDEDGGRGGRFIRRNPA